MFVSSVSSLKSDFMCSSQQGYDSIINLKIFQIYKYIGSNEVYDAEEYKSFIDKYTKILETKPNGWFRDYFKDE